MHLHLNDIIIIYKKVSLGKTVGKKKKQGWQTFQRKEKLLQVI